MIEHINIPEERKLMLKKNRGWIEMLKKTLEVDINTNEEILVEGNPIQVLRAKEIIKAFARGFSYSDSLDLLDEDYFFEIMDVKNFTGKSKDRQTIMRGRVIGKEGRMKKMIEKIADVKIAIYGKTIGIIGKSQNIRLARSAVEMILSGSRHNSVYRFLQEHKVV